MYVVYFGTDRTKVRDAAGEYAEKNLPADGTLTTLDAQNFGSGQIADALGASSLFGGTELFVLDTPSANPDFEEEVKASLKEMGESTNTFIVLEGPLLAPAKKAYGKFAASSEEYTADKAERFNTFGMAEALAQKDKRRLWVLLQEARKNNLREEEIVGMLWWQLKSLRLAAVTQSASEAGMKDFPYNKAKRALTAFAPGEVVALSRSLLELYHAGHSGMRDMDIALEQWVLTL
jgi:DNA polymerase III delta subunit